MMVRLIGGPYDDRQIWAGDILRFTTVMVLKSHGRTWRFIYLPDPDDWPAVLRGEMTIDQSKHRHYYELVSTADGPQLHFDKECRRYWEAMTEALRDMPDRNGRSE